MRIDVEKILEFSDLFPEEHALDIYTVLKQYNREHLVKCAHVLSNNFDKPQIPDLANTFFSDISKKYIDNLNNRIIKLQKVTGKKTFVYSTQRTVLELLRIVFDIAPSDYKNNGKKEDFEFDMFRVILQINENLMKLHSQKEENLAILTFSLYYIFNDFSNLNPGDMLLNQINCYLSLSHFLCSDLRCERAKNIFYQKFGILNMHQYARTWLALFTLAYSYQQKGFKKCPVLDLEELSDEDGFITPSILDYLSIPIDATIPYLSNSYRDRANNVDYRCFRAHPLIKIADKRYLIYSLPILLERLYSGMFWDIKDGFNDPFNFYNKEFVEKVLFRTQIVKNLSRVRTSACYPTLEIISENSIKEEPNQPDFYIREKESIILFECKAIRINGALKDKSDIDELLKILKTKLYNSDCNIDKSRKDKKSERVGVTQLVHQMKMIDEDTFKWDKEIPDNVAYYPVIVLEDSRLVKPGITYIINSWYKPLVLEKLPDQMCNPIVVMSINTLMTYCEVFNMYGFHNVFDEFYNTNVMYSGINWQINKLADFDSFMSIRYKQSQRKLNKRYMQAISSLKESLN